jgi:type IV fimbrial biogenesis protein FimT
MKNRSQGFTLLELMIVVALTAVILGIGVPNFREFLRNNKMASVANDFLGGIQTARTEAIKRQLPAGGIAICPSNNPDDANPSCLAATTRQFNGWIAFVDADDNCDRDTANPNVEVLIRTGSRVDLDNSTTRYVKSASNGSCISFSPTGFMRTTADAARVSATRTVYCDERGNVQQNTSMTQSLVRGIDVTVTGRARITRDKTELTSFGVSCP